MTQNFFLFFGSNGSLILGLDEFCPPLVGRKHLFFFLFFPFVKLVHSLYINHFCNSKDLNNGSSDCEKTPTMPHRFSCILC